MNAIICDLLHYVMIPVERPNMHYIPASLLGFGQFLVTQIGHCAFLGEKLFTRFTVPSFLSHLLHCFKQIPSSIIT